MLTGEALARVTAFRSRLSSMEGFPGHAGQANVRTRRFGGGEVGYAEAAAPDENPGPSAGPR